MSCGVVQGRQRVEGEVTCYLHIKEKVIQYRAKVRSVTLLEHRAKAIERIFEERSRMLSWMKQRYNRCDFFGASKT